MLKGLKYLLITTVLYVGYQILSKLARSAGAEAYSVTFVNIAASAIALAIIYAAFRPSALSLPPSKALGDIGITAFTSSCVAQTLVVAGLALTTITNGNIVLATNAAWTAIIAGFVNDEKLSRKFWLLSLAMFLGSAIVSSNGQLAVPNFGDMLLFCAAATFGLGHNFAKRAMNFTDSHSVTFWRFFFATIMFLPLTLLFGDLPGLLSNYPAFVFSIIAGVLFALNVITFYLSVSLDGPSISSLVNLINPTTAILADFFFFSRLPTVMQIGGGVLVIVCGYLIVQLGSKGKIFAAGSKVIV